MAYDGNGNYNLVYNWVNDYNLGILIQPDRMMGQENDIAAALSLCITRDGQGKPTTNISWNNCKVINLADATSPQDALNQRSGDARYLALTGGGTVTGSLSVTVDLSVGGNVSVGGSLTVTGALSMGSDINMNNHKVSNLAAPTASGDAATKAYVDSVASAGSASVSLVTTYALVNYFGGF